LGAAITVTEAVCLVDAAARSENRTVRTDEASDDYVVKALHCPWRRSGRLNPKGMSRLSDDVCQRCRS
jgi:hypothetical protein